MFLCNLFAIAQAVSAIQNGKFIEYMLPLRSHDLQMVGVASSPEFQTHLPKATEYRVVAPA